MFRLRLLTADRCHVALRVAMTMSIHKLTAGSGYDYLTRLENLDRAGFDASSLVQSAAAKAPLPDDHPAAALWWRVLDELPQPLPNNSHQTTPAVARLNATNLDASHIEHRKRRLQPSAPVAEPALMIARCRHRDLGDTKTCFDAPGTEKG
jgi:hypothetical protein